MSYKGFGTEVTFGTSSFAGVYTEISGSDNDTRNDLDVSHMGTTGGYREYEPGGLLEGGEFTMRILWDGTLDPPSTGAAENITIDFGGAGVSWAFSGYVKGVTPTVPLDDVMMCDITVKVAGAITKDTTPGP